MNLSGRRVVVTGGAGFIGSHVVDRLTRAGCDVVAYDNLTVGSRTNLSDATARGARLVVGDVRDAQRLPALMEGAAMVVHMAADNLRASLGEPFRSHDVNATGGLQVLLAAASASVERFVYVSSSEAYGTAKIVPMAEDHPLDPTTVYGASKAAGELYARACLHRYGLPVIIVRPFNSYGPREHASGTSGEVIPKMVHRIRAGIPPIVFGDGSQTRDFTWVEETAAGIVAAAQCDELVGEAVNIARGQPASIAEVCECLLSTMEAQSLRPEYREPRPGDVMEHWAATGKAERFLGFRALVDIQDGLGRYVRWADENDQDLADDEVVNW
jgi:UDP-glucose 4-epimerase